MGARPLVVATRNRGKAREFARLLGAGFHVEPLPDRIALPPEEGRTFHENARSKAMGAYDALGGGIWVLADDSGLEVDALDGRPGVQSARYAGESATDEDNVRKVLKEIRGRGARSARFICALVLVRPVAADGEEREILAVEGRLEGVLENEARGGGGFGYDPIFRPVGWEETLAQASGAEKDAVSHRGDAVRLLQRELEEEDLR